MKGEDVMATGNAQASGSMCSIHVTNQPDQSYTGFWILILILLNLQFRVEP
jgi:hypothetical protein